MSLSIILNGILNILGVVGTAVLLIFASKYIYLYQYLFIPIGLFATRHFPATDKRYKYAVVVAARNEETVIGHLIDSIRKQDYPQNLLTVFVVADNCTDNTAEIARSLGAVCYERFDNEHRTKGYALEFLFDCISKDYGIESFDGYFLFDADNLLKSDYISRMNEAFASGEKLITSYRNTKNFGENWISASYGVHWLRTARIEHRARSVLRLAARIQGTGVLMANEVVKDGWHYTSLTEDRALSADAVVHGYRITYNNDAEFFDEQPTSLKIAMRQRIRWSKGHIQAFGESSVKLLINTFKKASLVSLDMLLTIFPKALAGYARKIPALIYSIVLIIMGRKTFGGSNGSLIAVAVVVGQFYAIKVAEAAYVFIAEHKRIPHIPWYKIVFYCLTWPSFDLIGGISLVIALFKKVEWKPIPHKCGVNINEIPSRSIRKEKENNDDVIVTTSESNSNAAEIEKHQSIIKVARKDGSPYSNGSVLMKAKPQKQRAFTLNR